MKISYNWLRQYIDIDMEPRRVAEILTSTGLEVEGIETFESVKGSLEGLVIGKVISCERHPNADKLSITKVDVGNGDPLPIVCGAPNVAEGQKVVVAPVGATLYPSGSEDGFKIKKAKIRGELSEGMICAEDELGLGSDHSGIIVMDKDAVVGQQAARYFNIESDTVFEIGLTPNRIDGASHIGVARDIYAWLKHHESEKKLEKPSISEYKQDNANLTIPVDVEDEKACLRYSGVTLTNLEVLESPEWLKNRLLAIGQTPINNIVDITNYVLHECGQPLHAFDAAKIKGGKVIVKTLPDGTRFTTLDEKERTLTGQDLMICNKEEGMCIGGVFGGVDSGVTNDTRAIFLESATFNPVHIRKTSKHHVLNTDASFRFERGTDPNQTIWALKRAALLMKELAGAEISSEISDFYPHPVDDFSIVVSFTNINRLVGKVIPPDTIKSILESLDILVTEEMEDGLKLKVPPYRVDVQREADIVEEVLRIYGYNSVEFDAKVNSTLSYIEKPDHDKLVNVVSDMLSGNGFLELKSNSLTREAYFEKDDQSVVKIHNPLSQDLSRMRKKLLFGGLEAVQYNLNRKQGDLRMYEFGNCYHVNTEHQHENPRDKFVEHEHLGIFLSGNFTPANWVTPGENSSFYHLKSIVELVFGKLGLSVDQFDLHTSRDQDYSEALDVILNNKVLATFGRVNASLLSAMEVKQEVYAAEMNWDEMMKLHANSSITVVELPKYPEVKRDLSLMLDRNVSFEQLKQIAFSTEKKILKKVDLFDVYEGDKISKGKNPMR